MLRLLFQIISCGFLLGELVAKFVLALAQICFVTVGIDERVRVAVEQTFVFLHEMEEAPVRYRFVPAPARFVCLSEEVVASEEEGTQDYNPSQHERF